MLSHQIKYHLGIDRNEIKTKFARDIFIEDEGEEGEADVVWLGWEEESSV